MGGHGACANPNLDLQKQRVQFWLRHPHFCQCCVFWDVGLALAPSWAPVELLLSNFQAILWCALAFVGRELEPYWP